MKLFANSKNFIEDGIDIAEWETINKPYLYEIIRPIGNINYTKYTIDLSPIIDFDIPPTWLKVNSNYIDYTLSRKNIENQHLIDIRGSIDDRIDILIADGSAIRKTAQQLIDDFQCDFDSDNYKSYLTFNIVDGDLVVSSINDYKSDKNCFSLPFLKSIIKNNKETDLSRCNFDFVIVTIGEKDTVAFRVTLSTGKIRYYDYSHNPKVVIPLPQGGYQRGNPFYEKNYLRYNKAI